MSRYDLTHEQLAGYVRELLLCGHLIDRATMPHVLARWDRETMRDIAIDEWMGTSPIYTKRTQRLLGFQGDDVETIFKGMQFDIGAPPQFMDFRYTVHDAHHGEFHLDHCGALMDVEPMGEEYVFTMCHDIEDPTFDATAWATNPKARMRPIHRPPREPADRHPHCAWTVTIDPDAPALEEPEMTTLMAGTRAASLGLSVIDPSGHGAHDYTGALVDDIDFTEFSTSALEALADEIALQGQLLAIASMSSIAGRFGVDAAIDVARHQLTGSAGVTAERLRDLFDLGPTLTDVVRLFEVHPVFRPTSYVATRMTRTGDQVRIDVQGSPALEEADGLSWPSIVTSVDAGATVLGVIAQALDPALYVARCDAADGAVASFIVARGDIEAGRHPDVELARFSTGADFTFVDEGTRVMIRRSRSETPTTPRGLPGDP